jgi:hypothetical protein
MSRDAIEREKKSFRKIENQKNQESKDRKNEKTQKAKMEISQELLRLRKQMAEAKTVAIFSIRLEPAEKSRRRSHRNAAQLWDFERSQSISPLMRPPSMKRLSPSLLDGPTFLRRSVVGSVSNRGRNYEPVRLRSFCG